MSQTTPTLTPKDFATDQDVRWCPGCGDYSILKQTQTVMAQLGIKRENIVIVAGIGCSSRFPYYMNTYGMHTIHGRAPAIATGIKITNPQLSVWVATGDGDALSIGGNHLIHVLRRNVDLNILMFNNQIYGLTKGQYSPTTPIGVVNKTSPMGTIDYAFNPPALALGAEASFVARSMDRDPKHLQYVLKRAHEHKGASFVEIYQNCNIFNDGAFFEFTEKNSKSERALFLEHGKPLIFGKNQDKGIRLDGFKPVVVSLEEYSPDDLWIHDEGDLNKAQLLARMSFHGGWSDEVMPRPFGVLYKTDRPVYEEMLIEQIEKAKKKEPNPSLDDYIRGQETWVVK